MTQDEIRQGYNRTALVKAPAALLDVVQAPAAAGLNLIGQGAKGINYLFGTNLPEKQFSMTPFYDAWVRQPEQQLATGTKPMPKPEAGLDVPGAKPDAALLKKAQQYDNAKTQYDTLIAQAAQTNGIDPVVFKRLIGTESSFNPSAVSPRGEKYGLGIAQIASVHGVPREDMLNPQVAIPFAAQLFSKYLAEANGDYQQAIMKYKGASSTQGKQSMTGPAATILAGIDPTKTQAPAKRDVTTAAKTGTAKDVAEAVVESLKPASGGTMYGAQVLDPSMRNPVIQQTLAVRKALQDQVAIYSRYGRGDLAMAEAAKIQAIDLGLYKGQADIGLYEGATTGNFSRAMSVLSAFTGAPHQVLQRPDGKGFDLYINGKVAKAGLKGDQVEMLVRTQVDAEYRKQLASVQAERGMEEFKSGLRIKEKASEITLNTAKEIQKAVVEGNIKLAEEKLKQYGLMLVFCIC
jgi:soluble lytic murein transglycosylase-like protein